MPIIFSDNFESGDFSNWDDTAGNVAVVTNPFGSGKVFRAAYDGDFWGLITKNSIDISPPWYYQYDIYVSTLALSTLLDYRATHGGGSSGAQVDQNPYTDGFWFNNIPSTSGGPWHWEPVFVNFGDSVNVVELVPDGWHTMRIDFDGTVETFTVDGSLLTIQHESVGNMNSLILGPQSGAEDPGFIYFDNVIIGTPDNEASISLDRLGFRAWQNGDA